LFITAVYSYIFRLYKKFLKSLM